MKATMCGANFNRLISAVRAFVSKNTTRPQYSMIQLQFNEDGRSVTAYALDGYRIAKEIGVCYTVDEDFKVLISAPPLKANGEAIVEIGYDDKYSYISYGNTWFRFEQPYGEWFAAQDFFDKEMAKKRQKIAVNVDYLLDAVKAIKATGATSRRPVIIEFGSPYDPVILRTDRDNPKAVLPVRIKEDA